MPIDGSGRRSIRPQRVSRTFSPIIKMDFNTRKLLTRIGIKREDFSVAFSLSDVSEIECFVAREKELAEYTGPSVATVAVVPLSFTASKESARHR